MDGGTSDKNADGSETEQNPPRWRDPTAQIDGPYIVTGEIHGWDPAGLIRETSRTLQADVATARKHAARLAAKLQRNLQDESSPKSFGANRSAARRAVRVGTCLTLHLLAVLFGWWLFGPWAGFLAMALLFPLTYIWLMKPEVNSRKQEEDTFAPVPATSISCTVGRPAKAPHAFEDSPEPEEHVAVEPTSIRPPLVNDGPMVISSQGIISAGDMAAVSQTLTGESFDGPQVMIMDEDGVSMFFIGTRGYYKVIPVPGRGVLIKFAREGGMPTNENITGYFYSTASEADVNAVKLIVDVLQPKNEVRFYGGYVSADPGGVNWKRYTVDGTDVILKTKRADEGISGELHIGNSCIVAFCVGEDGMLGNVQQQVEHSNLEV